MFCNKEYQSGNNHISWNEKTRFNPTLEIFETNKRGEICYINQKYFRNGSNLINEDMINIGEKIQSP